MSTFVTLFISFLCIIYFYYRSAFQYWKKRNVPFIKPRFLLGNAPNPFTGTPNLQLLLTQHYQHYKALGAKHFGCTLITTPIYVPIDLEIIKNILIKDFNSFVDRGVYLNEKANPLSGHLFNLRGKKWKNLRAKLTPVFTSGKMKNMFETLLECGRELEKVLAGLVRDGRPLDVKELMARFTTDIISSVAFGLELHTIENENSPFRQHGKAVIQRTFMKNFIRLLTTTFPNLSAVLGIRNIPKDTSDFFLSVVKDTVDYRERNKITRNDFLQLLIELKNQKNEESAIEQMSIEQIAAQCFVFFIAGFETSSTTMSFAFYEMCHDLDVQKKLRSEIDEVLRRDGEFTYNNVMEMKYLDQVVSETLRKYPAARILPRECTEDYKIPGTDLLLEKGTKILVPTLGIHLDEEFYPDPDKFDPERFNDSNKRDRHPMAYFPFGEGPRICIGSRFGLLNTKLGLVLLLKDYKFTIHEKTKLPIELSYKTLVPSINGDLWLKAERIVKK